MSSLDDLVDSVIEEYKKFDISTVNQGKVCCYDPQKDEITLNFQLISRYLDYFKILHEIAHRVQRQLELLYGNTSLIELNANKIASEAYVKLGFPLTYEVTRHINYNNVHQLNGDLSQREIMRLIAGKKELVWNL